MTTGLFLLSMLVILLFSGAFSGFETGQYCLNRVRLKHRVEKGESSAVRLFSALRDPQIFLFTILIGNNICVYIASSLMTDYYATNVGMGTDTELIWSFLPWSAEVAATLTLMLPFFVFAEAGPKNLFRQRTSLMYHFSPLLKFLVIVLMPLSLPLKLIARVVSGKQKDFGHELETLNLQRLKMFLKESVKEGVISGSQHTLIDNILLFNRRKISEAMFPMEKLECLSEDLTIEEAKEFFRNNDLNSIPIFSGEKSNLIGVLPFFGVISAEKRGNEQLKNYITQLMKIEPSLTVQETFSLMQSKRVTIALVVDKDGRTMGLVKLKDIIRLITGGAQITNKE